jgi:hypothetical protein
MSRVFIDGFETGDKNLWSVWDGCVVPSAQSGMGGSYSLLIGQNDSITKIITAEDEMYFAMKFRAVAGGLTNAKGVLQLFNGSTIMLYVTIGGGGSPYYVKVYDGADNLLGTGTTELFDSTTYLIEIYVKIANSGGRAAVRIDRVVEINFTGDTQSGAETQFDRIRIGDYTSIPLYGNFYIDDVVFDDATGEDHWIGQTFIQPLVLTGAGNSTQWSPSSGSNYTCVDERPASDSDFVSTDSVDQLDLYTASDLSGDIEAIKCVQLVARTVQEGTPTPQNIQLAIRSGGSNYFSGDKAVPLTTPEDLFHIWETDPDTASAWTESGVNAIEIGVKSVA